MHSIPTLMRLSRSRASVKGVGNPIFGLLEHGDRYAGRASSEEEGACAIEQRALSEHRPTLILKAVAGESEAREKVDEHMRRTCMQKGAGHQVPSAQSDLHA
jgi:hypothetical protein